MKLRYALLLILIGASVYAVYEIRRQPYDNPVDLADIPTFSRVALPFKHEYKSDESLAFTGAAVIDIENDGTPELFLGGGYLQRDGLFEFVDGRFEDIGADRGLGKAIADATYAASTIDVNRDGFSDLFVGRDSGLYLYYNQDGFFVQRKLAVDFADHEVPVSIALGDINRDNRVDLFVSCLSRTEHPGRLVFSDAEPRGSGKLLLNNGDNTFSDITGKAGVAQKRGSFSAVFAEMNNDRRLDLVVTYRMAPAVIYKNVDGRRFEPQPYPGSTPPGFATGAAAGDINNDGRMDVLLTGTGTSLPDFLLFGRFDASAKTSWSLLRNDGAFQFTDVANPAKVAGYELAWGAVFADFNLDGRQDIAAAQNLRGWPPQWLYKNPGRVLIQKGDRTFGAVEHTAGAENRNYGANPLTADFNNDGYPDLVWVNIGGPAVALINDGGNARYLKVDLGNEPAALGARIRLRTNAGQTLHKQHIADTSLGAGHRPVQLFGIGPQANIDSLEIQYLSGKKLVLDNPPLNRTLQLRQEPASTPAEPPPVAEPEPQSDAEPPDEPPQPSPEPETDAPPDEPPAAERETSVEDELEELLSE